MTAQKLPVGIDSFEKLRREGFYYVDKTGLIVDLMQNWGEVNLFTALLRRYRVKEIWTYGIAFWEKECRVVARKVGQ